MKEIIIKIFKFIIDPITDDEGRLSITRIILLMLVIWVMNEGNWIMRNKPEQFQYFVTMAVGILGGGFILKLLQSFSENGININNQGTKKDE